jgi:hypothetical protein
MTNHHNQTGSLPIIFVLVLGIVLAGAIYGTYRFGSQQSTSLPPATEERPKASAAIPLTPINFSRNGNLLDREGWILLYEEPGNPAIDVTLKFTQNSRCDFGRGELPCETSDFRNGSRVEIEGNQSGKEVSVLKMRLL